VRCGANRRSITAVRKPSIIARREAGWKQRARSAHRAAGTANLTAVARVTVKANVAILRSAANGRILP
jgi:hypothetical protein